MKMEEIINLFNGFSTAMKVILIVIGALVLAGCLFVIVCYVKGIFYIGVRLPDQCQTNSNCTERSNHAVNEERPTSLLNYLERVLWFSTLYIALYTLFRLLLDY